MKKKVRKKYDKKYAVQIIARNEWFTFHKTDDIREAIRTMVKYGVDQTRIFDNERGKVVKVPHDVLEFYKSKYGVMT